jgi:RlmA, N-terminal
VAVHTGQTRLPRRSDDGQASVAIFSGQAQKTAVSRRYACRQEGIEPEPLSDPAAGRFIRLSPICNAQPVPARVQPDNRHLICGGTHSFDIARDGYVNLAVGRTGTATGDTAIMIAARARNQHPGAGYWAKKSDGVLPDLPFLSIRVYRAVTRFAAGSRSSGRSPCVAGGQKCFLCRREQPLSSRPGVSHCGPVGPRSWLYPRLSAASRSSMLPAMMARICSVMCWSGQSHQASASRRLMSSSL